MNTQYDWCVFSRLSWDSPDARPHHIARELSGNGRVLWVEPPESIFSNKKFQMQVEKEHEGISRVRLPGGVPLQNYNIPYKVSSFWWRLHLQKILKSWRNPDHPLAVLVHTPASWGIAHKLKANLLIYDSHDDWRFLPGNRREHIEVIEHAAALHSDHVLASSEWLSNYMEDFGASPISVPNACDFEVWDSLPDNSEPSDIRDLPHPRFMFFGGIDESFDFEALLAARNELDKASWIIIGSGNKFEYAKQLCETSTCRFLGSKPYQDLPRYAAFSDVFILPYRLADRNNARDTLKLYEYLATGKPVACNQIAQTRRFLEVLCLNENNTPEGFLAACKEALAQQTEKWSKRRKEVAKKHTWKLRIKDFLSAISDK